MRKHFNPQRICSSEDYELSKKLHKKDRWDFIYEELRTVNQSLKEHQTLHYIKVFGKVQYIPENMIEKYKECGCTIYVENK